MRIYIAGRITNYPEYKEDFAAAAFRIRNMGHEPVIPFTGTKGNETYKQYIDHGLDLLKGCDAIYMISNWPYSNGAILERMYAETVGMKIIEERVEL